MTDKIESLTAGQEARLPEFVERWTQIGLSTEPADRPRAESAIRKMYVLAGLAPPRMIVWCGSPVSLGLAPWNRMPSPFANRKNGASPWPRSLREADNANLPSGPHTR